MENELGTMYSGKIPCKIAAQFCQVQFLGTGTKYATNRLSPGMSSRTTTTACRMAWCWVRAFSTSPSSIRKPRILTW